MAIKRSYNNSNERIADKAEKTILPLLEQQFMYQLGLQPRMMMTYDPDNQICKVGIVLPKIGSPFTLSYAEHKIPLSYPRYSIEEMSKLVEYTANCVVGAIQDSVSISGCRDPKRYAADLYASCIVDEDTFLTWIDQVQIRVTPKDELLRYYQDHKHEVQALLKDEGYFTPFPAILHTFSEDEIRDMSDTTLEYIIRVVNDIRKLHQAN